MAQKSIAEARNVFVVVGKNDLIKASGCVGVSQTKEGAEQIAKDNAYQFDDYLITEHELKV